MKNDFLEDFRNFVSNDKSSETYPQKGRILVVDGLNVFLRNFQAVPAINHYGEHVGGVLGFFRGLHKAIVITLLLKSILYLMAREVVLEEERYTRTINQEV